MVEQTKEDKSASQKKTEIFRASSLVIQSARKVHFQIDGEYLGLVKEINALLIPRAIEMILPVSAAI